MLADEQKSDTIKPMGRVRSLIVLSILWSLKCYSMTLYNSNLVKEASAKSLKALAKSSKTDWDWKRVFSDIASNILKPSQNQEAISSRKNGIQLLKDLAILGQEGSLEEIKQIFLIIQDTNALGRGVGEDVVYLVRAELCETVSEILEATGLFNFERSILESIKLIFDSPLSRDSRLSIQRACSTLGDLAASGNVEALNVLINTLMNKDNSSESHQKREMAAHEAKKLTGYNGELGNEIVRALTFALEKNDGTRPAQIASRAAGTALVSFMKNDHKIAESALINARTEKGPGKQHVRKIAIELLESYPRFQGCDDFVSKIPKTRKKP